MKKFVKVEDGVITNIAVFDDKITFVEEWLELKTNANIGDPVVDGVPISRPSKYHTLENKEWVVTSENKKRKDDLELSVKKRNEIRNDLKQIDDIFKNATTVAGLREATGAIFKKIIPFII